MRKKLIVLFMVLTTLFAFISTSTMVYADNYETYSYEDESATAIFTLKDEGIYDCVVTNKATNEVSTFSSGYIRNENIITFYLTGEILLSAEIGENNVLIAKSNEGISSKVNNEDIKLAEEYATRIGGWIISGILGILGTIGVAVAFRKQLKTLFANVLNALSLLSTTKDETEKELKAIKKEAEDSLKSLKNVKEEVVEISKTQFNELNEKVILLSKIVIHMAGGMKELVVNGTSENINNLIKTSKDVKEDANKEV